MSITTTRQPDWHATLEQLGFGLRSSSQTYVRDEFTFTRGRNGSALSMCCDLDDEKLLTEPLGRPGLWKPVKAHDNTVWRFDIDMEELAQIQPVADEDGQTPNSALEAVLRWAIQTASGEVPHVRLGKAILYPVDSLREWLARQVEGKGGVL